ncbi:MAG: hypothetical protein V3U90_01300 [Dehalococcoidia bacterium]
MITLAQAIKKKHWDLTALSLLLGMLEVASKLPQDTLIGLLEALEGDGGGKKR